MHCSRSDFVPGKWSLPNSDIDGGKDYLVCKELVQVTLPALHRSVPLAKQVHIVLKQFDLPLHGFCLVVRCSEERQRISLDWIMDGVSALINNLFDKSLILFLARVF